MVDEITWLRYPYYEERGYHDRRKRPPMSKEALDAITSEKHRKRAEQTIIVNAAYIDYQLLWDDFTNALRAIRVQARAAKSPPPLFATEADKKAWNVSLRTSAKDAAKEAESARAALDAARYAKSGVLDASRNVLEAEARLAAARTAESAAANAESMIAYQERWTDLNDIVDELAKNAYVDAKNSSAGVGKVAYKNALLAMAFE